MKPDLHPVYRPVIFEDASTGTRFLTRSTMSSAQKAQWEDGQEYPLVSMEITSQSHPYFTGQQRLLDTAGRVEKFTRRYQRTTS